MENYREINRIITKNYIKKKDPAMDFVDDEDINPSEMTVRSLLLIKLG